MRLRLLVLLLALVTASAAVAQMFPFPGPGRPGAGGGGSVSFTYTSGEADTSSGGLSTVTFNNGGSNFTFTAGFNVACFAPAVGGPVTSMTIKGASASFLGSAQGDDWAVECWGATVTSGTGTVVVNLTGTSFGSVMAFGVLSGSTNTVAATARLNSPTTFAASQGTTTSLTLSAGDLGLVAVSTQNNFGACTYTGATAVGNVTNTRPANISIATMSATGTPTVTNQGTNSGSIVALKFTP